MATITKDAKAQKKVTIELQKERKDFYEQEPAPGISETCYHILVYVRDEIVPIRVDKILLAYAEDGFHFITTGKSTYLVSHSLTELEKMLGNMHFRVNRQFIISYQIINRIFLKENAKLMVELKDPVKKTLSVSKRKSSGFRLWLTNPFKSTR